MRVCCLFSHDSNVKSQVRVSEHFLHLILTLHYSKIVLERTQVRGELMQAAGHHPCPGSSG